MPSPSAPARRLLPDLLVIALGATVLIGAAIHSTRVARFWTDECLTAWVVEIDSPSRMLAACKDTINAAPPLYFVLGWIWVQAFGSSVLALRIFTALGFALGFGFVHRALRRAFAPQAAGVAAFVALLGCRALVQHDLEARFYGLYFAEIAALVWWLVRDAAEERASPAALAGWLALHAALVTTHYFGFVYSGALLASAALVHVRDLRRTAATVLAGVAGWLTFVPWIPSFRRHLAFGGDGFWVPRPYLNDALEAFDLLEHPALTALLLGATAVAVALVRMRDRLGASPAPAPPEPATARARTAWLAIAVAFALVPPATFVASRLGTSLFLERYFFPSTLTFAALLAWTWQHVARRAAPSPTARTIASIGAAALIATSLFVPLRHADHRRGAEWPYELQGEQVPGPFVLETTRFLPLAYYAADPDEMLFVQDRELAFDPATAKRAMNSYQIIEALARHVPTVRTITTEDLFARHDRFVVVDWPNHPWFELRVLENSTREARPISGSPVRWEVVSRSWTIQDG